MFAETIALGVLINCIYDFLKMGITVETAKFKSFVDLKGQQISDDIANEVIAVLKQDDTIKQLVQDGKEADIQSHIENSPMWKNAIQLVNSGTTINAENGNVHTGTGDLLTDNSRKVDTGGGDYIESQTIQATEPKKP